MTKTNKYMVEKDHRGRWWVLRYGGLGIWQRVGLSHDTEELAEADMQLRKLLQENAA